MASRLKKSELREYKATLLGIRARLSGDVSQLASEALREHQEAAQNNASGVPLHLADIGSDAFEQEFTLTLLKNEEDAVKLVDAALDRIEQGGYGNCEDCEGVIPKTRLKAIPYTPHCVSCARKYEED